MVIFLNSFFLYFRKTDRSYDAYCEVYALIVFPNLPIIYYQTSLVLVSGFLG